MIKRDSTLRDYFYGREVENTVAEGKKTLFIAGPDWTVSQILELVQKRPGVEHIYLAANHTYSACNWLFLANELLKSTNLYVSLEQPVGNADSILTLTHPRFIPIVSVVINNVEHINPNAALKIDVDLNNVTNPGVWVHSVHSLLTPQTYTPWKAYEKDSK